jgi:peptidoglycan/LPS O-acetylase OafA/YrhL
MSSVRRAEMVVSIVALAAGVAGLLVAIGLPFTSSTGEIVLGFGISFNPLGAVVMIALAALGLAGAALQRPTLVLVAAVGFALYALQVVVQFGRDTNWFGSRGSNLSLAIGLATGLGALALGQRSRDRSRR